MELHLKRLASSLLLAVFVAGGLDGALVFLCAEDADLSLMWRASAMSGLLAWGVASLSLLFTATLKRAYPQVSRLSFFEGLTWLCVGSLWALVSLVGAQWSLRWAHAHIRSAEYQALAVGGGGLVVTCSALLLTPLAVRGLLSLGQRAQERLGVARGWALGPTRARCLALALCLATLYLLPLLWAPLSTLDLGPLYLLVWALWVEWTLAPALARLLPRRPLMWLASLALLTGLWGLERSANALSARQSQLLAQRGLWAQHVVQLGRHLTDSDGDGHAHLFAGGDCKPRQRRVRPGAYEPVGRDLNCNGFKRERAASWPKLLRGARPPALKRAEGRAPRHLILITVDALRADAFERYMPKTRAFAERAARFKSAYSAGAATYWSIPSLIGSKPPSAFHMERDQTPAHRERLLFEVLRDRGFHTTLLSNVTIFFVRGLSQGALTQNYETSKYTRHGERPGAEHMTANILKQVDKWRKGKLKPRRDRLALWAHYYDPHEPYFPLEGRPFASDQERYIGTVRALDQSLEALFRGLDERGMLSETAMIFTADHGDEFGEHGGRHHGKTLYEEMVRVPLWVYSPTLAAQELSAPLSHVDVAPSALELLGLPAEPAFQGVSWLGSSPPLQAAFFEVLPDRNYGAQLVGLVSEDGWKLIYDLERNAFELYQLQTDPDERRDLSHWLGPHLGPAEHKARLATLQRALLSYAEGQVARLARGKAGVRKPWGSP